jgi:acyl-CoA synthetase (AMP-forming)/AMP-acid ligase II
MSEAAGQICSNPLDAALRRPGSVGQPVGVELRIADEAGAATPEGVPGEVQIRGPGVTDRYLVPASTGSREATPLPRAARDASGWLSTGDIGYRDPDGFVYLMGRTDGVINRGGEKVYPREVEEVLRAHPAVAEAAVCGEPDAILGERPVAFVVPRRPADAALEAELLAECRRQLSRHKHPDRIHVIPSLPLTATGKVRRGDLLALSRSVPEAV